ncbi:hypothetical protein [Nocardiopsis aegyptia]|uniref:Uncharacterized protein n=1 Tax=Nocardiopsis aegyptia TaxID=220378 RepID=A0A7Z0ERR1_9ACTN|nr:hypothetical protein [Nocardiopsis aegyptia]NYJ36531.1 hypothetical protein [Nocardiopsis aegyptia]
MSGRWPERLLPWTVGVLAGVLALGPALGPGYVLRYDMVFVPDLPLGTVLRGADGFPRAIPSDAVVALASLVLPGDAVQSLALLAVFAVGGTGAARLMLGALGAPGGPGRVPALLASAAAGTAFVWNPFVAERLLLGQWAMLLGYAGLPWAVGAASRLAMEGPRSTGRSLARLVCALIPAAVGGFSSVVLTALTAGPVALTRQTPKISATPAPAAPGDSDAPGRPAPDDPSAPAPAAPGGSATPASSAPGDSDAPGRLTPEGVGKVPGGGVTARWWGRGLLLVLALVLVSLPWLLPSLVSGAATDPAGVAAFAARSDTPFGVVGSLALLGGVWNSGAVPPGYGEPVTATARLLLVLVSLAGWVWWVRRARPAFGAGLSVAAVAGLAVALLGASPAGQALVRALIGFWPGFGPLRDGQLYVAPLALVQALGLGAAVVRLLGASAALRPVLGARRTGFFGLLRAGARPSLRQRPRPAEPCAPLANPPVAPGAPGLLGARPPGAVRVAVAAFAVLAPIVVLPGLLWGAGGRLAPVDYPAAWTRAQEAVAADDVPGAVLVLPWSAYRGLEWTGEPVVVLDPATKAFDRRTLWNDDLVVGTPDGGAVVVAGEDARARAAARALEVDPATGLPALAEAGRAGELARVLGGLGVRYVVVSAPIDNQFWSEGADMEIVLDSADLALLRVPEQHINADKPDIPGLEVTGGLVTVGAIIWSIARSGSSLGFQRFGFASKPGARKEIPK